MMVGLIISVAVNFGLAWLLVEHAAEKARCVRLLDEMLEQFGKRKDAEGKETING